MCHLDCSKNGTILTLIRGYFGSSIFMLFKPSIYPIIIAFLAIKLSIEDENVQKLTCGHILMHLTYEKSFKGKGLLWEEK